MAGNPSSTKWEADQMLNAYILDYLRKRGFVKTADEFIVEARVPTDPVLINAPGGFVFEWWSVFWDIFSARTKKPSTENAKAYVERQKELLNGRRNEIAMGRYSATHRAGSQPTAQQQQAAAGQVHARTQATQQQLQTQQQQQQTKQPQTPPQQPVMSDSQPLPTQQNAQQGPPFPTARSNQARISVPHGYPNQGFVTQGKSYGVPSSPRGADGIPVPAPYGPPYRAPPAAYIRGPNAPLSPRGEIFDGQTPLQGGQAQQPQPQQQRAMQVAPEAAGGYYGRRTSFAQGAGNAYMPNNSAYYQMYPRRPSMPHRTSGDLAPIPIAEAQQGAGTEEIAKPDQPPPRRAPQQAQFAGAPPGQPQGPGTTVVAPSTSSGGGTAPGVSGSAPNAPPNGTSNNGTTAPPPGANGAPTFTPKDVQSPGQMPDGVQPMEVGMAGEGKYYTNTQFYTESSTAQRGRKRPRPQQQQPAGYAATGRKPSSRRRPTLNQGANEMQSYIPYAQPPHLRTSSNSTGPYASPGTPLQGMPQSPHSPSTPQPPTPQGQNRPHTPVAPSPRAPSPQSHQSPMPARESPPRSPQPTVQYAANFPKPAMMRAPTSGPNGSVGGVGSEMAAGISAGVDIAQQGMGLPNHMDLGMMENSQHNKNFVLSTTGPGHHKPAVAHNHLISEMDKDLVDTTLLRSDTIYQDSDSLEIWSDSLFGDNSYI